MARVHQIALPSSRRHEKPRHEPTVDTMMSSLGGDGQATLDVTAASPTMPSQDYQDKSTALLWQLLHDQPAWGALLQHAQSVTKLENNDTINHASSSTKTADQVEEAAALQLLGLAQEKRSSVSPMPDPESTHENEGIAGPSTPTQPSETAELKRGAWTAEEDMLLLNGIKKFGYGRWKEIASTIPGRKGKQIKQRWDNTLAPRYFDRQWLQHMLQVNSDSSSSSDHQAKPSNLAAVEALLTRAVQPDTSSKLSHDMHTPSSTPMTLDSNEATALALYLQQHSHGSASEPQSPLSSSDPVVVSTSPQLSRETSSSAMAAAAAAAVAAMALSSPTTTASPSSAPPHIPRSHQRRPRSDPALAETQSDAMSIYASPNPIMTTVDDETQTVYPCLFPDCGKTFARLYNLKSHSRTHTDDRPFHCRVCHAAFSRNHDLKRHVRIHGGNKPYQCLGCNKHFSRLDALKRHKSNRRSKPACMSIQ